MRNIYQHISPNNNNNYLGDRLNILCQVTSQSTVVSYILGDAALLTAQSRSIAHNLFRRTNLSVSMDTGTAADGTTSTAWPSACGGGGGHAE